MSPQISTHVLDAALGRPAAGITVSLEQKARSDWLKVTHATTDEDGRVAELGPDDLDTGVYRVTFDTDSYFAATGQTGFYPEVVVIFNLAEEEQHYHVPLLLSPFAFSTYRGS
jgi:5-hydroxyisourate hydrolase